MRNLRCAKLIALLCLLALPLQAGADALELQQTIDDILNREAFSRGFSGCVVRTLDTGETLYSHNPGKVLMTASNMKLVTSAAALALLGPDYRYTTKLLASGPIDRDGVLHGDLILQGSGDPLLDTPAYEALIADAKTKGLKRVTGAIVADTGSFSRSPYGWSWSWDYLSDYYAAPVGGLNFHKNVMEVMVGPGANAGDAAQVSLQPGASHMRVRNSVITGKPGEEKRISRDRDIGGTLVTVEGVIPVDAEAQGAEATVAVYDPAQYAVDAFRDMLQDRDVQVDGRPRKGETPSGAIQISQYISHPLSDTLVRLNKWSDNLVAEALLRTIGAVKENEGSVTAGRRAAYRFFEDQAGMDTDELQMADGSGLSRFSMISTGNMILLLTHMYSHPDSRYYIESLPIAGEDGTLRNRMKDTPAQGKVTAKTGYIGGVSGLSGYLTTRAGQPLAFSILFNNQLGSVSPCIEAQNDICAYLAGLEEKL